MRLPLGTIAAFAVIAPTAQARIVIQESIAGVKVGMTAAQVREVLGAPRSVRYPRDEIQGSVKVYDYGRTDVTFARGPGGKVQNVSTTSRAQRTSKGIGVGSTRAALRRAYPQARCEFMVCTFGRLVPGRKVTSFVLSARATVTRVQLGIVID